MFNKDKKVIVTIDNNKCTKCGLCIKSCSAEYLLLKEGEIRENKESAFGCIQCGNCMMACPNDAITIEGEGISKNDIVQLTSKKIDSDDFHSFLLKRRSSREFTEEEISNEIVEKVLKAASTSAISIPPSEVKVLIIKGKSKVQEFADDIVGSFKTFLKTLKLIKLFKPLMKKEQFKLFDEFVIPILKETVNRRQNNKDILFFNAPIVVLFYSTNLADKEDSIIAATTATLAAESIGLGTCIIGSVPPVLNKSPKIKEKYGISKDENVNMAIILGHPKRRFTKGINRRFKEVRFID